ncbi:MAG: DUF5063 domain-containing protein [Thiobacillus sp.]|nr:DUF5063 domain-containing protein [Thiobacillus sp.]
MKSSTTYSSDFAEVARAYCSWCEATPSEHTDSQAAYWLSRLYSQALLLPQVGPENEDGLPELPPEELAAATKNLAAFAGRYYREVFDPDPLLADEPVLGDIGDDLLDTYKDVRAGLVLFDRGETNEAMWHWSFLHRIHWGRHAVGAMYALHCLAISQGE